jgi:hypothetical protein
MKKKRKRKKKVAMKRMRKRKSGGSSIESSANGTNRGQRFDNVSNGMMISIKPSQKSDESLLCDFMKI